MSLRLGFVSACSQLDSMTASAKIPCYDMFLTPLLLYSCWKKSRHQQRQARFKFQCRVTQLFPAPVWPKTKLSGRKSCPKGPARTLSMVPIRTSNNRELVPIRRHFSGAKHCFKRNQDLVSTVDSLCTNCQCTQHI